MTQASFCFVPLAVGTIKTVHFQQRVCRSASFCSVPFPFCFVFSHNMPNHSKNLFVLLRSLCSTANSFKNRLKLLVVTIRPSICLSVCSLVHPSIRYLLARAAYSRLASWLLRFLLRSASFRDCSVFIVEALFVGLLTQASFCSVPLHIPIQFNKHFKKPLRSAPFLSRSASFPHTIQQALHKTASFCSVPFPFCFVSSYNSTKLIEISFVLLRSHHESELWNPD